ncbi:amidohydrolase family protein [Aristophania vespae]|uniref:adenosine deaminase n=1 Tax=Aristophania vespae TaxID=2697033 RepID=UPI0023512ADA|nr:adenosine deaminase [Aristophania vespae]UMM63687.1 Adenosine deaminase [Aristophania vespae]
MLGAIFHVRPIYAAASTLSVEQLYNHIKDDPLKLRVFLRDFPKGGDLNNHLVGAIYAETWLKWAGEDGLCVSISKAKILPSPCGVVTHNEQPAQNLGKDLSAWSHMVAALSMRDFVPMVGDRSAHDHFFGTFTRFAAVEKHHQGDMLAKALQQAARDHVIYIEIAVSPALSAMINIEGRPKLEKKSDLSAVHEKLLPVLGSLTKLAQQDITEMEKQAHQKLHCGEKDEDPACQIEVRYLFQTSRNLPLISILTQLEVGYFLTKNDSRFVGVTLSGYEDDPEALDHYKLQMEMFHFLNGIYPAVNIVLPAGELTANLVPPENLTSHIRDAIDIAGAQRIGQAMDILHEDDSSSLLEKLADHNILVELNLTRNEKILNIRGNEHPFTIYRQSLVPVAFISDNEGILRSDLTEQYSLAAKQFRLNYGDLIKLSRVSLEYAFVPGKSLWVKHNLGHKVMSCNREIVSIKPSKRCASYLKQNQKAALEWRLELALKDFAKAEIHKSILSKAH